VLIKSCEKRPGGTASRPAFYIMSCTCGLFLLRSAHDATVVSLGDEFQKIASTRRAADRGNGPMTPARLWRTRSSTLLLCHFAVVLTKEKYS
jgi:hypothetical protein